MIVEYAGSVYSTKRSTGKVSDRTYSGAFRGCIKGERECQLQFLSCFSFVVKSGVIISCLDMYQDYDVNDLELHQP